MSLITPCRFAANSTLSLGRLSVVAHYASPIVLIAFVGLALAAVQSARASTITVANTNDSGAGCLRQALLDSNDGDAVKFDPSVTGTITLTSGALTIAKDVTINGPGASRLAVNGNNADRVFYISTGTAVTISGLTITNGSASGGSSPASDGGGIYNDHATLTLNNCSVSGNSAAQFGGGIVNNSFGSGSATLTINNCSVSGNSSSFGGGGIFSDGRGGSVIVTINNSTLSGNSAPGPGSGIWNDGNSGSATLTIKNSTLSNSAAVNSGGIFNDGAGGSGLVTIGDTILKTGTSGQNIYNSSNGTVISLGYNLSDDAGVTNAGGTGALNATGDQTNTDPMLGPLAYYGGPTPTHILLAGSPAIDKGKNFSGATNDQRGPGFARTVGSAAVTGGDGTDIGAFERQANDIDPTLIVTTTADTNANPTCSVLSPCSLRDAITAANASVPDDIIYFAVTGTITLNANGAFPDLNSNMQILGPGANALTIGRAAAASAFRIFEVPSGKTVALSGLTITGGLTDSGAGIQSFGTLSVNNSAISHTMASSGFGATGGAIENNAGVLTVTNSTISENSAVCSATIPGTDGFAAGGGILNVTSGRKRHRLSIARSPVTARRVLEHELKAVVCPGRVHFIAMRR